MNAFKPIEGATPMLNCPAPTKLLPETPISWSECGHFSKVQTRCSICNYVGENRQLHSSSVGSEPEAWMSKIRTERDLDRGTSPCTREPRSEKENGRGGKPSQQPRSVQPRAHRREAK